MWMQWSERNIFERGSAAAAGRPGVTSKLTASVHRMNHEPRRAKQTGRLFVFSIRVGSCGALRVQVGGRDARLAVEHRPETPRGCSGQGG